MGSEHEMTLTRKARINRFFTKHWKKLAAVLLIAVVIIIIAVAKGNQETEQSYQADLASVVERVVVSGRVQAVDDVDLAFETSGRVVSLPFDSGDRVSRGSVLARLDASTALADLAQAEAQLDLQRAAVAGVSQSVADAETNLSNVIKQQSVLVASAYRNLLNSDVEARLSSGTTSYVPEISGTYNLDVPGNFTISFLSDDFFSFRGSVNGTGEVDENTPQPIGTTGLFILFPNIDTAPTGATWSVTLPNVRAASYLANYNAYQSALENQRTLVASAEAELAQRRLELTAPSSADEARIRQAEAQVQNARARVAQYTLRAPFAGVVSDVSLSLGEIVSPNTTAVRMLADAGFEIRADLPEIDVARVAVGDAVMVTLDAYGAEEVLPAVVTRIDSAETIVDGVPVYKTIIHFTEPSDKIRSGMTASITIETDRRDDVVAIPVEFIEQNKDGARVQVRVGEHTEWREVTLGLRGSDGLVEITSGLEIGDTVVADF